MYDNKIRVNNAIVILVWILCRALYIAVFPCWRSRDVKLDINQN